MTFVLAGLDMVFDGVIVHPPFHEDAYPLITWSQGWNVKTHISDWLEENCSGKYHIERCDARSIEWRKGLSAIHFDEDHHALLFKMTFL